MGHHHSRASGPHSRQTSSPSGLVLEGKVFGACRAGKRVCVAVVLRRAGLSGAPSILWKATGIGFSSYASRHSMCSIVWPFCSSCEELRDCRLNVDLVCVAQKASKF
eukprot:scaffold8630_cov60-Phaeocystis_antarctica.AAC.3